MGSMMKKSLKVNAVLSGLKQLLMALFPLITVPYITRVLEKTNYGRINFATSFYSYFLLIASLGIPTYAIAEGAKIREDKDKIRQFANEIYTINMIMTGISVVIYCILFFTVPKVAGYRSVLIPYAFYIVFTTAGVEWINTIYEDYLSMTLRYIVVQVVALVGLFVLIKGPDDYVIYAWIFVITNSVGLLINRIYISRKYIGVRFCRHANWREHIKPLLVLFANSIAISIYVNVDSTMISLMRSDAENGIYGAGVKIYTIIKQMIASVVAVLIPRVSSYIGEGKYDEYKKLLSLALHVLIVITVPCVVVLVMMAEPIIYIVAGEQYLGGVTALRILSVAVILAVLSNLYIYNILVTNRKENIVLYTTFAAAVVNFLLNLWLIPRAGHIGAAITTILAEALVCGGSILFGSKVVSLRPNWKDYLPIGIGGMAMVVVLYVVHCLTIPMVAEFLLGGLISGIVYLGVLFILKDQAVRYLLNNAKGKRMLTSDNN